MHKLKEKRTARRQQSTRLINEAKAVLDTADLETLGSLTERLHFNNEELRKLNAELEKSIPEEEFAAEFVAVMEYEDAAKGMLGQLKAKEATLRSGQGRQMSTVRAPLPVDPAHCNGCHRHESSVKLPTLQLQTFSGELCQWLSFWTQYKASVHDNHCLTKGEKFQYLRSLLSGPAADSIAGLHATEDCYDDAVEILSRRFGDTRRIVQEHLGQLRSLPSVVSSNDIGGLRRLLDHVQCHVRGLAALKICSATYSAMMTDILLRSLPSDIVIAYHRQMAHTLHSPSTSGEASSVDRTTESSTSFDGELDALLAHLQIEVECRERSAIGIRKKRVHAVVDEAIESLDMLPSTAVLTSTLSYEQKCLFCGSGSHPTELCDGSNSHQDKLRRLAAERRCFRCTRAGHFSRDCILDVKCGSCTGRHVTSVCYPRSHRSGAYRMRRLDASNLHCNTLPPVDAEVLLQTCRLWIIGTEQCAYIRGIVDGGSQRSFIREDVSRTLRLRELGKTTLHLHAFGNDKPSEKECRIVQVRLRSQYSDVVLPIEAIEVPFICNDIVKVPTDSDFVTSIETSGGPIADKPLQPGMDSVPGISLLIGADHLWKVMTGELRRHPRNHCLVALNSIFGWMFHGPLSSLSSSLVSSNVCGLRVSTKYKAAAAGEVLEPSWPLDSAEMSEAKALDDQKKMSVSSKHWKGDNSGGSTRRKRHQAGKRLRHYSESDQCQERTTRFTGPRPKLKELARIYRRTPSLEVESKSFRHKRSPQRVIRDWRSEVSRWRTLSSKHQKNMRPATMEHHLTHHGTGQMMAYPPHETTSDLKQYKSDGMLRVMTDF